MKVTRTRIKVCGMTDPKQVTHAVMCGVDAIGMILHADSPRTIGATQAKRIREVVPPFVTLVGVLVDCEVEHANRLITDIGLDLVQLHGSESAEDAQNLTRPYIKAIRAQSVEQISNEVESHQAAVAILLDPFVSGQHGGTGVVLKDELWPSANVRKPLMLAGGLSPSNVAQRIRACAPYAVDVNSGVEIAPGDKDPVKVAQLVEQVALRDQR
jgi:phosphoribosylanthranilate isomerase